MTPLHVDLIIRFEHYDSDFKVLARALGRNNTVLPHKHGSKSASGILLPSNPFNLTYNEEVGKILKSHYQLLYSSELVSRQMDGR